MRKYDFSGWATKNDLQCADGRIIRRDAFKQQDGQTVSLVWNHQHNSPDNVLGHALLENRADGVYAYCTFNDSDSGRAAKELVNHGDVASLSIYANQLKQVGHDVIHGIIRELSLVLAGANPGATIDTVISHDGLDDQEEDLVIDYHENITLYHSSDENKSDDKKDNPKPEEPKDDDKKEEEKDMATDDKDKKEKTVQEVFDTLTEEQKNAVYAIIGTVVEETGDDDDDDEGGKKMKHNVFDDQGYDPNGGNFLSHSDEVEIINMAKQNSVGSLRTALNVFAEQSGNDTLAHGIDDIEVLFPDARDVRPGAPERINRDLGWVDAVINNAYKTPFSRIRTRQMDTRDNSLRAGGYKKGTLKTDRGNMKLYNRTTDPQTVYVKDKLNRDDILDITDFDVAAYIYEDMREKLKEELATAIMIGDGREAGDEMKIDETHIRPIWTDEEFFTLHVDVDVAGARQDLNGTATGENFGDDYIYAEAIIRASLFARENFKGTGQPSFYCTPHLVNVMLLARDHNGRRLYDTVDDLAKALNVEKIHTVEQFDGLTRTADGVEKGLLGIFVNMKDYTIGSTKGGEITRFNQFDIDFNQEKYLLETRLSGALTRYRSAIALEETVES